MLKEARGDIFYSYYIMVNMNLGKKARHTASITNRTSIFGIMGGTIQSGGYRNSIRSATYRATTYNKIPPRPTPGKQYMLAHNLLSRNPQCSGGVGRMHTHPGACGPCNCEGVDDDGRGAPHGGNKCTYPLEVAAFNASDSTAKGDGEGLCNPPWKSIYLGPSSNTSYYCATSIDSLAIECIAKNGGIQGEEGNCYATNYCKQGLCHDKKGEDDTSWHLNTNASTLLGQWVGSGGKCP